MKFYFRFTNGEHQKELFRQEGGEDRVRRKSPKNSKTKSLNLSLAALKMGSKKIVLIFSKHFLPSS